MSVLMYQCKMTADVFLGPVHWGVTGHGRLIGPKARSVPTSGVWHILYTLTG